jgi:hypothetical protein
MRSSAFLQEALRQLPDLKTLEDYLQQNLDTLIESTLSSSASFLRTSLDTNSELETIRPQNNNRRSMFVNQREQTKHLLEQGKPAISKIRKVGIDADLTPEELEGFEAIVLLVGRPAILIQDGSFFRPPPGWEVLEQRRIHIEETCRSVGRIEVAGHPTMDWIGTGFLVAENVIMTNRHVAKEFCQPGPRKQWTFEPLAKTSIDYIKELSMPETFEFELTNVIGIHETLDLALFKTAPLSSQGIPAPKPFTLASKAPRSLQGHKVYVMGYPGYDSKRNDPDVIHRIFSNIYGVKRLQPGEITAFFGNRSILTHDCSTLGGNSGSCLVDIETNKVVGLHFSGRYLQANYAVALWQLTSDQLLKKARVWFD